MGSKLRLWWQKIKQHRLAIGVVAIALVVVSALIIAVCVFGWEWTGFTGYTPPTPQYQRGKTFWDVMQLLIIPVVLAVGGFWLNQIQKNREEGSTAQRAQTEREIALDNQREAALQDYLDRMSTLLLEKSLRLSKEDDEVRNVARAQTLTALRRLDTGRKGYLFQFLCESGLVRIIDLSGVDLAETDLSEADLSGANLSKADLRRADLYGANLGKAKLSHAILSRANLYAANLTSAVLFESDLHGADLNGANLTWAVLIDSNLREADLCEADLTSAILSSAQLQG